MVDEFLSGFVGFLALLGVVALVIALFRTAARVVLGAAEEAAASGIAESSARRGDLTAMTEARQAHRLARASRRRSVLTGSALMLWIVVPLVLGAAREAWALAAPLWLLPRPRVLRERPHREGREGREGTPSSFPRQRESMEE